MLEPNYNLKIDGSSPCMYHPNYDSYKVLVDCDFFQNESIVHESNTRI